MELPVDDTDIIEQVRSGNRDAFAQLVRKYQGRVRGYCAATLRDATLAEDAAQEIFLKVYQALGTFRGSSSFSTWLYRITANHCRDLLRRLARQRSESWEALLEKDGEKIEALLATAPGADLPAQTTELVAQVLSHLPEQYRTIVILRELQGLSYEELASTLDCSLDAVKSRLRRARQELEVKLRHFLRERDV